MASLTIERLVPALKGAEGEPLWSAINAVVQALDLVLLSAGASDAVRREAEKTMQRVVQIALGDSPETRPGRKLPWWRRPR